MSKGAGKNEKFPEEEPHQGSAFAALARIAIAVEPDWIIDAHEHEDGHQAVPWDLRYYLRQHEDLPAICLGWSLANFVKRPLGNEMWHLLLNQLAKDGQDVEYGEHLILQALDGQTRVEKD